MANPSRRLVWTNGLGPASIVNPIGTGPMDFGFTADIRITETDNGCDYGVTVHHGTPQAAKAHENMGFTKAGARPRINLVHWLPASDHSKGVAKPAFNRFDPP